MRYNTSKWLPHLKNSIPKSIGGYSLSFYSVALEGWRRGLKLKFINNNTKKTRMMFELSSNYRTHRFIGSRGDLVSNKAINACIDKSKTKDYLEANNVPTPKGKCFNSEAGETEIAKCADELGYPVVLKPTYGYAGKGVIAGIQNKGELLDALNYVKKDLGFEELIIEEYFKGEDYRIYVVDNKVISVIKRVTANVIGDGTSTIETLIKNKNKDRKKSPILRSSLIKIDNELINTINKLNYTLNSIPPKNETVFLKSKNNISAGGDPYDYTDELPENLKHIAVDAVKALPNIPQAGVDLLVNLDCNNAVVIEVNSQPSIRTHLFPSHGYARDVPKEIIDFYFPEVKGKPISPKVYFDFGWIWRGFREGVMKEVVVPKCPSDKIELTRFIVDNIPDDFRYSRSIRRQMNKFNLEGYLKVLTEYKVAIVVAGHKEEIKMFKRCLKDDIFYGIKIVEKKRTSPVEIGFKIK